MVRPPRESIDRVLVIYRKSTFQTLALERRDPHFIDLIERGDATVRKMKVVHEQHVRCLDQVRETLKRAGLTVQFVERGDQRCTDGYDLMVTVGGDGTLLWASHHVVDTPVVGVVSSDGSVGHFCGADGTAFGRVLGEIVAGRSKPVLLQRLDVRIGGTHVPERALNDVLLCHTNPAATSRYLVQLGEYEEEQKSSGVWIASAAGSTAAIGSAGGTVLPPRSRRIQFFVREPHLGDRASYRLRKGFVWPRQRLIFASKMDEGRIFIDGPHISYPFRFGDRLSVGLSDHPLRVHAMRA